MRWTLLTIACSCLLSIGCHTQGYECDCYTPPPDNELKVLSGTACSLSECPTQDQVNSEALQLCNSINGSLGDVRVIGECAPTLVCLGGSSALPLKICLGCLGETPAAPLKPIPDPEASPPKRDPDAKPKAPRSASASSVRPWKA